MKRGDYLAFGVLLVALIAIFGIANMTGYSVRDFVFSDLSDPGSAFAGLPAEEQQCMQNCVAVGCEAEDLDCMTANRARCMGECNAQPAALSPDEQCVQDCIDKYCPMPGGPEYMTCMDGKIDYCDDECDMKGDAPDESKMSDEQRCISDCVNRVDPSIICGSSKEGETGNEVCQMCADQCVHLYEGPCLNDEQITGKENVCAAICEHCYGEPVMGESGEGWECIVDISCEDASDEFGDDPGSGPGIGEEGYEEPGIVESIGNFFSGLFGGGD
ncbi:MAG: hypothetical protein ABIE22_03130 [archaeon]